MNHKISFISKCTSLTIIILLPIRTYALGEDIKYSWLDHNDKYDVMVGISVDGEPVCSGILLSHLHLITSANPIERIINTERLNLHMIDGNPNRQKVVAVKFATRDQCKRNTGKWATFGFDGRHAPHHDLMLISFVPIQEIRNPQPRYPFACKTNHLLEFQSGGRFAFAGFGFIDKLHVKQNYELELVEYGYDDIYENCWEWFPSIWGHFICVANVENFVGISSGAGLFYDDIMVGIGSFAIKRGSEGVLVFTDFRKYQRQNKLRYHNVYSPNRYKSKEE